MKPSLKIPSPVSKVHFPVFDEKRVEVYVKREDLIHPLLSGNKWRKLKYGIQYFLESDNSHIITFGGAFSNHIHAFGHACHIYGLKGVVIIRGEEDTSNPTIDDLRSLGIELHFVSRKEYRLKENSLLIKSIIDKYESPLVVPEGGSSEWARPGVREMALEIIDEDIIFDHIAISAGTGCTSGCMIDSLENKGGQIEVYSALKGAFMKDEVGKWAGDADNWQLFEDEAFGGYGKVNASLVDFINDFYQVSGIPLDPIYNGKLMYHLVERIESGAYQKGSVILWVHTGGLQGIRGFNYRWRGKYEIHAG